MQPSTWSGDASKNTEMIQLLQSVGTCVCLFLVGLRYIKNLCEREIEQHVSFNFRRVEVVDCLEVVGANTDIIMAVCDRRQVHCFWRFLGCV